MAGLSRWWWRAAGLVWALLFGRQRGREPAPPQRRRQAGVWLPASGGLWIRLPAVTGETMFVDHRGSDRLHQILRRAPPALAAERVVIWRGPPRCGKSAGLRRVCHDLGLDIHSVPHEEWAALPGAERLALLGRLRRLGARRRRPRGGAGHAAGGVLVLDNARCPGPLGGYRGEDLPAALPGWWVCLVLRTDPADEPGGDALVRGGLPPGLRWSPQVQAWPAPGEPRSACATMAALQMTGKRYRWPPRLDPRPLPPLPPPLCEAPDAIDLLARAHAMDPDPGTLAARACALRGPLCLPRGR